MKPSQFNTDAENDLITAAARGDREAFGELVKLYERLVYNTVKTKVSNSDDALDISQEIFIKMWRSIANYRGDCRFTTWLYKICTNACYDFLRREQHSAVEPIPVYTDKDGDEVQVEFPCEDTDALPESAYERRERIAEVRAAIMSLSPEQREVVVLRDIEGRGYEEIAEMLCLEIGTVKSRLNRARNNLKALLAPVNKELNC